MDAEVHVAQRTRSLEVSTPFFRKLALASAISLYAIIASGATVRLTGSGLGCEGWPGCSPGAVFPEQSYHSFIEFGNRVVSIFPIVLSLATAVSSHFVRGLPRWVRTIAWAAALGTIAQAPLGLLTVRLDLDPVAVMSHFLLAIAVLAAAVIVAVEAWRIDRGAGTRFVSRRFAQLGLLFAALTLVVVVTGTFVTASGPHAGDPDVVDRLGNIERTIWVHVRATAVFGVLLLGLVLFLRRDAPAIAKRVVYVLLALAVTQAVVGELQWREAVAPGGLVNHLVLPPGHRG